MAGHSIRNPKYGAYAYISTPSATSLTEDTWTKLSGTFTNEILDGFAIVSDTLTFCCSPTYFQIIVCGTFESDTASTVLDLALYKNGVLQTNSVMTHELNSTVDVYSMSLVDVFELGPDDTVEIYARADRNCNVTANTLNTSAQLYY